MSDSSNKPDGNNLGSSRNLTARCCRVPDCQTKNLNNTRRYCVRHRMCEDHLKSLSVMIDDKPFRFCQKCSRLHETSVFDSTKHSCRASLEMHKIRHQSKQQKLKGKLLQQQDEKLMTDAASLATRQAAQQHLEQYISMYQMCAASSSAVVESPPTQLAGPPEEQQVALPSVLPAHNPLSESLEDAPPPAAGEALASSDLASTLSWLVGQTQQSNEQEQQQRWHESISPDAHCTAAWECQPALPSSPSSSSKASGQQQPVCLMPPSIVTSSPPSAMNTALLQATADMLTSKLEVVTSQLLQAHQAQPPQQQPQHNRNHSNNNSFTALQLVNQYTQQPILPQAPQPQSQDNYTRLLYFLELQRAQHNLTRQRKTAC